MAVVARSETELVARLRERDEEAFDLLVEAYRPRIRRWAGRMVNDPADIDDIAQEVLLASWRTAATLREDTVLAPWLKTITDNACRIRARTRARKPASPVGLVPEERRVTEPFDVAQVVDVEAALRLLPEREAGILRLLYAHDLSIEEAAGIMNVSPEAAKSLAARARRRFRMLFENWFRAIGALIFPAGRLFDFAERVPRDAVRAGVAAAVAATVASVALPAPAPEPPQAIRAVVPDAPRAIAPVVTETGQAVAAPIVAQAAPAPVLLQEGAIPWMQSSNDPSTAKLPDSWEKWAPYFVPPSPGASQPKEGWTFAVPTFTWPSAQPKSTTASPAPSGSPEPSLSPAPSASPAITAAPVASQAPVANPGDAASGSGAPSTTAEPAATPVPWYASWWQPRSPKPSASPQVSAAPSPPPPSASPKASPASSPSGESQDLKADKPPAASSSPAAAPGWSWWHEPESGGGWWTWWLPAPKPTPGASS